MNFWQVKLYELTTWGSNLYWYYADIISSWLVCAVHMHVELVGCNYMEIYTAG